MLVLFWQLVFCMLCGLCQDDVYTVMIIELLLNFTLWQSGAHSGILSWLAKFYTIMEFQLKERNDKQLWSKCLWYFTSISQICSKQLYVWLKCRRYPQLWYRNFGTIMPQLFEYLSVLTMYTISSSKSVRYLVDLAVIVYKLFDNLW